MARGRYFLVDVFGKRPFLGNPVAVVVCDVSIDDERMQACAAWNGMPETVFLQLSSEDRSAYHVRIFSPRGELAFAGHPSLGACHVMATELNLDLRSNRGRVAFRQHGLSGIVDVSGEPAKDGGWQCRVRTPIAAQVDAVPHSTLAGLERALGLPTGRSAFRVDTGARWLVCPLDSVEALGALECSMSALEVISRKVGVSGVTVYAPTSGDARFEVRSFGPLIGVPEDAACGGGNACVAALVRYLQAGSPCAFHAQQGRFVGRDCRLVLEGLDDGHVWVGGSTMTLSSGWLTL